MRFLSFLLLAGFALVFSMPEAMSESGGPDSFGYTFKDSNETDGPTYNWIDVSSNGTYIDLHGEYAEGPHELGFNFFFYGNWYNQWWNSGDNGLITFDTGVDTYWNAKRIPDKDKNMIAIAPFWSDLSSCGDDDAGLYYKVIGNGNNRALVIQYEKISLYNACANDDPRFYFQVILFETTGNIVFQYNNDFTNVTDEIYKKVSIGMQGSNETGIQYFYGNISNLQPNVSSQFSIRFEPPYELLNELSITNLENDLYFSANWDETVFVTIENIGIHNQTDIDVNLIILNYNGTTIHEQTETIDFIEGYGNSKRITIVTSAIIDSYEKNMTNVTVKASLTFLDGSQTNNEIEKVVEVHFLYFKDTFQENEIWDFSQSQAWHYSTDENEETAIFSDYRCSQNRPAHSSVISPSIDLSIGNNVWLEFSHSYYFYYTYDGVRLQIDIGSGFSTIIPEDGYPALIYNSTTYQNSISGMQAWTSYSNYEEESNSNWVYGEKPTKVYFNLSAYSGNSDVRLRWSVGFSSLTCENILYNGGYSFDNIWIYEKGYRYKHDIGISDIKLDSVYLLNNKINEAWYHIDKLVYDDNGNISVNLKNYGLYDIDMNDLVCNIEIRQLHGEGNTTLVFEDTVTLTEGTLNSGSDVDVSFYYVLDPGGDYEFLASVEYEIDGYGSNDLGFFNGRILNLVLGEGTANNETNWDGWAPWCGSYKCNEQEIASGTTWSLVNGNWGTGNDVLRDTYDGDDYSIVSPAFDFSNSYNAYMVIEHDYMITNADGARIEICFTQVTNCVPLIPDEGIGYDGYIYDEAYLGNPLRGKESFLNSNSGTTIITLGGVNSIPGIYKDEIYFKFRMGGVYMETVSYWTIYNFRLFSNGPEIESDFLEAPDFVYMTDSFSFDVNYTNIGTEDIDFGYVQGSVYNATRGIYYNSYQPISDLQIGSSVNVVFDFPYSLNPGLGNYQIYVNLVSLSAPPGESAVNVDSCAPSEFTSSPNLLYIYHPDKDVFFFYCADKIVLFGDINPNNNILESNLRIDSRKPTISISEESKALLEESNYTFIEGKENVIIVTTNDSDGYVTSIMWGTNHTGTFWEVNCYQNCTGEGTTYLFLNQLEDGLHKITIYASDNSNTESIWVQFTVTILADSDGDEVIDSEDTFPFEPTQTSDRDGDGYGDNKYGYQGDVFPDNSAEWYDLDSDGMGDNTDECPTETNGFIDADGDGYCEISDACPEDSSDWLDYDGDGVCNGSDAFPNYGKDWIDTDNDGYGDNSDAFPKDANEWSDLDGDGVGDNSDMLPENRFMQKPWQLGVLFLLTGATGFSIKHGYFLFTLSTRVHNKMDDVRNKIVELEERGVNTDALKKALEDAEKDLEKWILN